MATNRYDYEEVDSNDANKVMDHLKNQFQKFEVKTYFV